MIHIKLYNKFQVQNFKIQTQRKNIYRGYGKKNDLCERLLPFAVDLRDYIIQACVILNFRTVNNPTETINTKWQLINSSTSSRANCKESQGSLTRPDVKTKMSISLKEMRESNYFSRIYCRLNPGDIKKCNYLVNESSELKGILASILNKLKVIVLTAWFLEFEIWGFELFLIIINLIKKKSSE